MHRPFDVTERFSLQTETSAESIWAQEASDAWRGKSAAASPVEELEKFVDRKINRTTESKDDQKAMKDIAHALVETDLKQLDKVVKDLGKNPEELARLAKQLQEAFYKTGLRFTVSFDAKNQVLEFDDQGGTLHLYVFAEAGKVPMGTVASNVPYRDMKASGISQERQRVLIENSKGAAEGLQKSLLKRFADVSGK